MVGGHAWQGGMRGRYHEIQSMSGQYTSYWNAFLFLTNFILNVYNDHSVNVYSVAS